MEESLIVLSKYAFFILTFLVTTNHLDANPFDRFSPISQTLQIKEGREIDVTLSLPQNPKEKYPIALFLQGSGCAHADTVHITGHRLFQKYHVGILSIEKYGVRKGFFSILNIFHCPSDFWENNLPSIRVQDILATLSKLSSTLKNWNGDLILIGGQSAGQEAILVSKKYPKTISMVISNHGAGINYSKPYQNIKSCLSENKCEDIDEELLSAVEELKKPEVSFDRIRIGHMYETAAWWKESLSFNELDLSLSVPTLILHGGINRFIEVGSADFLMKKNSHQPQLVQYKKFEALDHQWRQANGKNGLAEVWDQLTNYLGNFLKPNKAIPSN